MRKICFYCGKKPLAGKVMTRKGQYKAKGGTGSKISRRNNRLILPNLQHLRAVVNGRSMRVYACTRCIKAGKVTKA
ncbi:50S ribosomal protein L28 [bacterium]|nr:MAG: 50S ribosomal protein L28 [bacterium]